MSESPDMRDVALSMVRTIEPLDALEVEHQQAVIDWISSGAEVFRTAKPATPPKHLVSYCVLVDSERRRVFLVDHRDAQLWLPTGGHVEPEEHPARAASREMNEELAIEPDFLPAIGPRPLLVTQTETVGVSKSHTDVSLWFAFEGSEGDALTPDEGEFADARWWNFDGIVHGPETRFDPHLPRFVEKLRRLLA